MPVKIRLQRRGRRKQPFYHIVVADARAPRDGRFIEKLGIYNPMTVPATIELDRDKAYDWLIKGAQPTDTARAILRFKGVLYRKHLSRGVTKGALSQEQADKMYEDWIAAKEAKIAERRQKALDEKRAFHEMVSGKPPKIEVAAATTTVAAGSAPVQEEAKTFAESVEQTTVESLSEQPDTAEAPAPSAEEPAAKEAAPATVEETPVEAVEESPADDLKKIEGIGPKIEETLQTAGIKSFNDLAAAKADSIKEILANAGGNLATHDPTTWPEQAKMAAAGEWEKLQKWQDELMGGKVVDEAAKAEEE